MLSWWTSTRTTTQTGHLSFLVRHLFFKNERMPTIVPRYLHLGLSKHVTHNVSRLRLRAHTLKVEATAWLEDGFLICDQCPGEDRHGQNEAHALLFCQGHRVCELRKQFSFLFTSFLEDLSAAQS